MGLPFADATDVADRWRPLSDAEQQTADVLCGDASRLLLARFPGIDGQIVSGQVDAETVTQVVAGMVKRAMVAPADGITSQSETTGPYGHSQTYANPLGNVFLTQADITLILGYQPAAQSHTFANTTRHRENRGPGFVYGGWV